MWTQNPMENGLINSIFIISIFGAILLILGLHNIPIIFFFFGHYMVPIIFFASTKKLDSAGFSLIIASAISIIGIYIAEGFTDLAYWFMMVLVIYGLFPGFYLWIVYSEDPEEIDSQEIPS